MKKTLLRMCVVLIAVMVFGLAGCTREAYTQEEMDKITQKGTEMMRAWLDENMPEAEIRKHFRKSMPPKKPFRRC